MTAYASLPYNSAEFYNAIPKKRMAAGALILNEAKEILLVKPSYRDYWLIPGGITEADEAPHLCALREASEETGLTLTLGRLLCVEYKTANLPETECLQFQFSVEHWTGTPTIDGDEITECRFFSFDEALTHLTPSLARRTSASYKALETGQTVYLTDGENPFGKSA